MQKLLSLTTKDFFTGITPNAHVSNQGLFTNATGINPFVNPFHQSSDVGLLQTASAPTDISGAVVVDQAIAGVTRVTAANTGMAYVLGDAGHFYEIPLLNFDTPTDRRSASPITNPANGIAIFQVPGAADPYLYYWQKTQIGRWDFTAGTSGFTDNYIGSGGTINETGIKSTDYHPVHTLFDTVYYGNKDRIGKLYNNAGSFGQSPNVLDFSSDFTVTALSDDGTYLVAAITKNLGDESMFVSNKIIFWDQQAPSWSREWEINDTHISALKKVGSLIYVMTGRGLYVCNYATPPQKIRTFNNALAIDYGRAQAADIFNEAVLWGGDNMINSYGKLTPESSTAYFQPFSGFNSEQVNFVMSQAKLGRILVGTAGNKLYTINLTSGGATSLTAETIYFTPEISNAVQVKRIDLTFGEQLASGDSLNVDLQTDEDTSAIDWGTASFTRHGAVRKVKLHMDSGSIEQFKLLLNFNGGNPKIKRIDVYGEFLQDI